MNRALLASLLLLGAVAVPTVSFAQASAPPPPTPASAMVPTPVAFSLLPPGEPTSFGSTLPPTLAVLPLRLSLMSDTFPISGALAGDACQAQEEANSAWSFPVQRATYLRLTPQLTLSGFSSGGCTLDAALGGGASYVLPLPSNLWLVVNAGLLSQPAFPGGSRTRGDVHVDIMMRPTPDRAYALGLWRRGMTFTGQW